MKKPNNYNYKLNLPTPIYSIYKYLFKDIDLINNVGNIVYASIFLALVTFCWIGLTNKLIISYFEVLVIAFITLYSLWFADNRISNCKGIFLVVAIIFLVFWFVGMIEHNYALGFIVLIQLIKFLAFIIIFKIIFWVLKIKVVEEPRRRKR